MNLINVQLSFLVTINSLFEKRITMHTCTSLLATDSINLDGISDSLFSFIFEKEYSLKPRLHVQVFPRDAILRNYCICVARKKLHVSVYFCAGNATSSEKLPKYCILLIFWQFICQQILPSHRVAGMRFFRAMATQ